LMNYKTVYDSDARYYEYSPTSIVDRMTQQVRRGTLLVGALLMYKNMLFNTKYGKFGMIILPAHFVLSCIIPWIFLLCLSCLMILTLVEPVKTLIPWVVVIIAIVASKKSRLFLISFVQSQLALIAALFRLARGRRHESLLIETIPSTRK